MYYINGALQLIEIIEWRKSNEKMKNWKFDKKF
jgi:hypothetical protein